MVTELLIVDFKEVIHEQDIYYLAILEIVRIIYYLWFIQFLFLSYYILLYKIKKYLKLITFFGFPGFLRRNFLFLRAFFSFMLKINVDNIIIIRTLFIILNKPF